MGNVTSLRRNGLLDDGSYGLIDDLTLSYDGNQLTSVSDNGEGPTYNNAWNFMDGADSGIEYEYDENGNVTKDLNRNILSIQYNSLNLPSKIEFADGKTIKYTYSADGHKLRAVYTTSMPATSKQIDYCGNLIFENGQLQQINVEGGYVTYVGSFPAYHHYIKDHLGNNRMVIHPSALYLQPQVNNYYPYGGLMANSTQHNQQRYKYNGKEFDRMHGLDWYDYGARWMDASIGRWHSVDPLCEKYYDVSPYVYCLNNPVRFIDSDGKDVLIWYKDKRGKDCSFLYNGTQKMVPNNAFVLDFVHTYNYLKANCVGRNVVNAVRKAGVLMEVIEADITLYQNSDRRHVVFWEPHKGILLTNGEKQSPAVRLEHEFDHGMDDLKNHKNHEDRKAIEDEQYGNKEEKRVITGSEKETASKLRQGVRTDHDGETYFVKDPRFTE